MMASKTPKINSGSRVTYNGVPYVVSSIVKGKYGVYAVLSDRVGKVPVKLLTLVK